MTSPGQNRNNWSSKPLQFGRSTLVKGVNLNTAKAMSQDTVERIELATSKGKRCQQKFKILGSDNSSSRACILSNQWIQSSLTVLQGKGLWARPSRIMMKKAARRSLRKSHSWRRALSLGFMTLISLLCKRGWRTKRLKRSNLETRIIIRALESLKSQFIFRAILLANTRLLNRKTLPQKSMTHLSHQ